MGASCSSSPRSPGRAKQQVQTAEGRGSSAQRSLQDWGTAQPSRAEDRVVECPQYPPSPHSPPISLQVTVPKMSLWNIVSHMPPEEFSSLFAEFPRSLRCLLADWLENQPW